MKMHWCTFISLRNARDAAHGHNDDITDESDETMRTTTENDAKDIQSAMGNRGRR